MSQRVDGGLVRRVGVIGDVHTEADTLERVLGYLGTLALDRVLCTGDLPDGPGGAEALARCCALLRQANAVTICGNHERWLQEGFMRDEPDAKAADIETLVGSLNATIVDGPRAGGLYKLRIGEESLSAEEREMVQQKLAAAKGVVKLVIAAP